MGGGGPGVGGGGAAAAGPPVPADWDGVLAAARGQTVYFNAWGGNERINAYIAWAGEQVSALYGITLRHVKLGDTAEAVSRVLAEKAAGRDSGGSVDLIWINGENFAAMKANGLLYGPFAQALPNARFLDMAAPGMARDFTVPVEGLEAPWGKAQLVFEYDSARVADPPRSMKALLDWARAHPGRFTYPAPPDFTGSTFLKQALYALLPDPAVLERPVDAAAFATASAPLWRFLDALHPVLWHGGRQFPKGDAALRQLLDDGEIDIAFSFNPGDASSAIAQGLLPDTVRTYVLDGGTIANTHFLAIPYNARAKEGAMVVANFLLSPEAQLRKQDPAVWGDPTVLDMDRLDPADRAAFAAQPRGPATLPPEALGPGLPEPHPSWMTLVEDAWLSRYAR
ncbi:MAG: ABC transporter substrate-binding protein [Rhodospirillaceae bacterium]|nr:ABC transporter substrate-binding protein [Rhodospirillaceae bacterium]